MSVANLLKQTNSQCDKQCSVIFKNILIVLINVNVHNVRKVRLKMSLLAEFEKASKSGPEGFCLVSSSFPEDKSKMDKNSVNEIP